MNTFPGDGNFTQTSTPINIVTEEVAELAVTDRGSLPAPADAGQLLDLALETPSAGVTIGDAGAGAVDFASLKVEIDLEDMWAIYGAGAFFEQGLLLPDYLDDWHWTEAVTGLYKVGPQKTDTIQPSITLDPVAALVNGNFAANAVAGITEGNVHVGLQLGGQDKTFSFPRLVRAVCLVGTSLSQLRGWRIFKSHNGRVWEEVKRSSLSSLGWSSGEKFYPAFRDVAATEAMVILLDEAVVTNYIKVVNTKVPTTPWNLREVLSFNRHGDLLASGDFINWTTDLPDDGTFDLTLVRFSPPQIELRSRIKALTSLAGPTATVEQIRAALPRLNPTDQAILRSIFSQAGTPTAEQIDAGSRLLGRQLSSKDVEAIRLFVLGAGLPPSYLLPIDPNQAPNNRSLRDGYPDAETFRVAGFTYVGENIASDTTKVGTPVLSLAEQKLTGRSGVIARAISFFFRPFTPKPARDTIVTFSHLEVYNRADQCEFGSDGQLVVKRLAGGLPGEVADNDDWLPVIIKNGSDKTALRIICNVPLVDYAVTKAWSAGAPGTFDLADPDRRIDSTKAILNAALDGLGAFGDSSFVVDTAGDALVTRVNDTPDAAGEYSVDEENGVLVTFTAFDGTEEAHWSYADEGSWAVEISDDGATPVKSPGTITLEGPFEPGATAILYVRGNQEIYEDNRDRAALIIAKLVFQGSSEDIVAV